MDTEAENRAGAARGMRLHKAGEQEVNEGASGCCAERAGW